MTDRIKCLGYVASYGVHVTCRCILDPHDNDVPHVCSCNGLWFGFDGQVEKVVRYPELIVSE